MKFFKKVVHCKVLDGSRKLKEEAQKAQAAEAKLKENEKLLAKFIKENQDLHADANMLIADKKEVNTFSLKCFIFNSFYLLILILLF